MKVGTVKRQRDAGTGVPNDGHRCFFRRGLAKAIEGLESHAKGCGMDGRFVFQVDVDHVEVRGDFLGCLVLLVGQSNVTEIVVSIRGNRLTRQVTWRIATRSSDCLIVPPVHPALSTEDPGMDVWSAKRLNGTDPLLRVVVMYGDVALQIPLMHVWCSTNEVAQ